MVVHPNPQPYRSEVIPMDENGLLETSFADAVAAIEQSSELPPSRRTDRQGAWSPPREHRGPLGCGCTQGQPASPRRQRRRMEDAGQPQVECESRPALVPQGQRAAAARRTADRGLAAASKEDQKSFPARRVQSLVSQSARTYFARPPPLRQQFTRVRSRIWEVQSSITAIPPSLWRATIERAALAPGELTER